MQKIKIMNFGPITDVELDISNFTTLIGPQASGKSTISKAVYFFKSLRDDFMKYALESVEEKNFDIPVSTFGKKIKTKFMEFWGTTYHMKDIFLQFYYIEKKHITLTIKKGYLNIDFSKELSSDISNTFKQLNLLTKKFDKKDNKFLTSAEIIALESEKNILFKKIQDLAYWIFNDKREFIFIPAGRSLLSTLTEQLQNIETNKLDYLMRVFLNRINNSKKNFNKNLNQIVLEKKKLTTDVVDTERVKLAQSLITKILKGVYINDTDGEKLFFAEKKFTRLNFSSSGQQESIWILLLIFIMILNLKDVFVVFEEPEAHLYPIAQKEIVDLISLLASTADNQIIITTHSPYILTSINNLLFACKLGKTYRIKVSEIVDPKIWIECESFQSFYISGGKKENIIDKESKLIKTELIDNVSSIINEKYDKLLKLDE
jgi:ABC-type cobalamin/Fe3+-siderophores transport system ATPase subunit